MNATKPIPSNFAKLPKIYASLCRLYLPRTLHDNIELEAVTEIIGLMAGHTLSRDQADYLKTLSALAEAYESVNHASFPALPPHEFLAAHLENIGIDRSTASRLLRGQSKFNTTHIRKTTGALGLEASLLI